MYFISFCFNERTASLLIVGFAILFGTLFRSVDIFLVLNSLCVIAINMITINLAIVLVKVAGMETVSCRPLPIEHLLAYLNFFIWVFC